jgi:hypothetical protein
VPIGTAFVTPTSQKRSALLITVGYVLLSCIFLAMVPVVSTFPFGMGYRYLLPIYPFLVFGAAVAADLLLSRRRLGYRISGVIVVDLLSIAAARSARATALKILGHGSQHSASCVSGISLLDELKRLPAAQSEPGVLTNVQGLAWYAMRTPTITLSWRALADAPKGTIIIFVRPENTCPEVLEVENISEMSLTRDPDVSIVSDRGVFLIGRKQ